MPTSGTEYVDDAAFLHRVRSLSPATDRTREVAVQRQAAAPAIDEVRFSAPRPTAVAAPAVVRKPAPAPQAAPAPKAAAMAEADEILFHSFRANAAEAKEVKPARKRWPILAGAGGALAVILAAVMVPLLHHAKASAKPVSAAQPTVTVIQQPEDAAPKPSPDTPSTPAATKPAASSDSPDASDAQPAAADQADAGPSQAQSQMMNDQLSAPSRIQRNQAASTEQTPPPPGGFGVSGMDTLNNGNAVNNVFSNDKGPKVEAAAPKVVNVSAGVAVGLLIQKTTPIYPQIAKAARVSGTVVLQANISKTGTIQNLHVVSGPMMLRQAAVDAVRTWRYKPYKLNNQPTEIQTTINVIFSLNG